MGNTHGPDRLYERKGQHATTYLNNHTPHSALTHTHMILPLFPSSFPFFFPLLLPLFLPFFPFLLPFFPVLLPRPSSSGGGAKRTFCDGILGQGEEEEGRGDDDDDSEDLLAGDGDDSDSLVASDEDGTVMFNSFQMIV